MVRKRKTASERRQENYEADRRAWEEFRPKLEAVQSFAEALALMAQSVSEGSPGRRYYSNLGFFLHTFAPPAGANATELSHYLRLIGRFDSEGVLKQGARSTVEEPLRNAMRRPQGW
jgi:hypothetical protein